MRTLKVTPEEMEARIVRFAKLTPRAASAQSATGIPREVSEFMAADRNFTYMAPDLPVESALTRFAAIRNTHRGDGLFMSIAACAPGSGPQLHAHMHTVESFFCLKSRFLIQWGDKGEHETTIGPYDFISLPPGVVRTFRNVGEAEGHLLVLIQGDRDKFNDVYHTPEVGQAIVDRFGGEMKKKLEATGRRFTAGIAE